MELEKVREFVEFTDSMNFTVAARTLHMSQPALSKHVKDLENELEVVLVDRSPAGGGNTLTPAGRRFLERSLTLLSDYAEAVEDVRRVYSSQQPARIQDFRSTLNITSQLRRLLEPTGGYSGNFAYVAVEGSVWTALDKGLLDLAVRVEVGSELVFPSHVPNPQDYGWMSLQPERLCVFVGQDNPLALHPEIPAKELERCPIVTMEEAEHTNWVKTFSQLFGSHGCSLHYRVINDNTRFGGAFPLGRQGAAICTERFAHFYEDLDVETTRRLKIEDFDPVVNFFLVWRKDSKTPLVRQVMKALGM